MLTADGTDDEKIEPEGLLNYKVIPPLAIPGPVEDPVIDIPEPNEQPEDLVQADELFEPDINLDETELDNLDKSERHDKEEDRTTNHKLIGKEIRGFYETGWHQGKIEYFNKSLDELFVRFEDGSEDYIKPTEIDGLQIVLVTPENVSRVSGRNRKSIDYKRLADGEN